jgi:putative ABC transport system permease protein
MLALLWLKGLLSRLPGRLLGAVLGVALTVALLATLGSFIASGMASMTRRAVAAVPVDWQVQLVPGADPNGIIAALGRSTAYTAVGLVGYADAAGFSARTGGTVQTTGPGKVLGLGPQYRRQFPAEIRPLIGAPDGVLVAQQTAANLRVTVGDRVTIRRVGLPSLMVPVDGIIDLPYADSLFQAVGVPPGGAPQAPPDNVVLLPAGLWHRFFDPQAAVRPDSVRTQLHVRIARDLAADPAQAYTDVLGRAHHLEALIAGSGIVADNLAARLLGARADALYAQVLFVFLGLPGVVLAMLLTLAIAASGADRRRREQALLRIRGASTAHLLRLEGMEALIVGVGGVAAGLGLAALAARVIAPAGIAWDSVAALWVAGAALTGLVLAALAVLSPAWAQARRPPWLAARAEVGRAVAPLWQRLYLDLAFLGASAVTFWLTARTGYQVVLAPEGVAQSSVAYQAFLAPLCLWLGVGLLATRLGEGSLARDGRVLRRLLRPVARGLAGAVAASMGRQRVLVTRGAVLVAVALSFAVSTAVFNTTYNAQSRIDAELTNGADVTVMGSTAAPPGSRLAELRDLPGVAAAQPMQHRFAYVGTDLQDLYGIDPAHIGEATRMSNAYFADGDARAALAALAARSDGVLVSAETARDYQLKPGDRLNLRLQHARDHQYHLVPFRFAGIVREFPTAPKDSFLVANAGYIAQQTGSEAAEIVLLRTADTPAAVAARARAVVSSLPGARVTDIGSTQHAISSSLTAVDLHGLTRLELAFAVLLVAGAAGLVLALGLAERRRTFAILAALGATESQRGAFLWSEGLVILAAGSLIGLAAGVGVARMLVTLLTGVFDPPPQGLSIPWGYLALLATAALVSTALAVLGAQTASRRPPVEALRDL